MAESGGLFGGLLGREEAAEGAEAEASVNLDPVAAALATGAAERGQALDPRLAAYLAKQEKLVEIQTEHLHEQRAVVLSNLKLKRSNERIKLLFNGVAAVVGATVLAVLGVVVFEAANSHALVIEPFSVPPDLAQQGLTGQTVAHQLQDRLAELERRSGSARALSSYEASWAKDVKVEIPETGVSLGEMTRLLHERLGHDTHISGEIFHDGPNLTLSVRAGEDGDARASAPAGGLDGLIETVAERVFERTEPYRYATWLGETGRKPEAISALRRLAASGSREDRIWAWAGLNNYSDSGNEALFDLRQGLKIDPEFAHLWFDVSGVSLALGQDEAALHAARTSLRFLPRDRGPRLDDLSGRWEAALDQELIDWETADFSAELATWQAMETYPVPNYSNYIADLGRWSTYRRAEAWARLHNPARARELLSAAHDDLTAARLAGPSAIVIDMPYAVMAADRGDWAEVARQLEPLRSTVVPGEFPEEPGTQIAPFLAVAYAHLGRIDEARALAASTPGDCYACLIARAEVESRARQWRTADRWFAEAERQGPSLPRGPYAEGESRMLRGDLVGAAAMFTTAAQRGPKWADPVKGLGDVAARRGDWRRAVAFYDRALTLAPAWSALVEARAAAAAHIR